MVSINPATEEIYGELPETSFSQLRDMVAAAKKESAWRRKSTGERVDEIIKLGHLLEQRKEIIARTMAEEMGKPLKAGRHEIDLAVKRIQAYCKQVPGFLDDEILFEDEKEKNMVTFDPLGVVGVISPWNSPIFVSLAMIVPPLLCGNAVLWKPSEHTSFTGLRLNELFDSLKDKSFPGHAFQMIVGGKDVGKKLVESDVDMVALTGSVQAGKEVMRNSADKLHKIVLELGGKDPALVLGDADLDKAAREIVRSSTLYTGQVCFGVERVYCHSSVFDAFVEKCVEETKKLKVGDPLQEESDIGPFAVKFQMEKVLEHLRDALEKGAKLVYGGKKLQGKGYFMEPGVMTGVLHGMKIMQEETFGPITPIMKCDDVEEMINLANDSIYGLTASVWTKDMKKGEEIARRIEAGTVEINRHGMSKPGCPWGGCKQSGIGRIYSKEGTREFCNIKHVWCVKS